MQPLKSRMQPLRSGIKPLRSGIKPSLSGMFPLRGLSKRRKAGKVAPILPSTCMKDTSTPAASPPPTPSSKRWPLAKVLTAVCSEQRWYILRELLKGTPLPVNEIARRVGATPTGTSKQCAVLLAAGVIRRGYGGLFAIEPRFLVPPAKVGPWPSATR